jgi:hypothetical protein
MLSRGLNVNPVGPLLAKLSDTGKRCAGVPYQVAHCPDAKGGFIPLTRAYFLHCACEELGCLAK